MTEDDRLLGERLRAYVDAAEGKPATFDECSVWPAQWVVNERGAEFDWPDYADEAEMRALIEREGGLVKVWERVARRAGLEEIPDGVSPPLGSICVVETRRFGQIGCIMADGQVGCFRTRDADDETKGGVRMIGLRRHTILKAWAV
jgi:hypothetical protein